MTERAKEIATDLFGAALVVAGLAIVAWDIRVHQVVHASNVAVAFGIAIGGAWMMSPERTKAFLAELPRLVGEVLPFLKRRGGE